MNASQSARFNFQIEQENLFDFLLCTLAKLLAKYKNFGLRTLNFAYQATLTKYLIGSY